MITVTEALQILRRALESHAGVTCLEDNAIIASLRAQVEPLRVVQPPRGTVYPLRLWFRVNPEAVGSVLPHLAESVATNYAGHPFRLLVEDAGDGEDIGPVGSLVLCYESEVSSDHPDLPDRLERLATTVRAP